MNREFMLWTCVLQSFILSIVLSILLSLPLTLQYVFILSTLIINSLSVYKFYKN